MSQQWRQNGQGFRIKFKNQSPLGNFITLLVILAGAALLLVVGVWLFFILLTIGVLLLPWLWWKRRKLIQRMQAQAAAYQSASHSNDGARETAGRVFEGEVITTEVLENNRKAD
jgi:threonine/homoserine/homoserine lactone efflux protein